MLMFTVEFVLCAQHDKSSQEPTGWRNNKLITAEATGLSRTAVFAQTPATPETLARLLGVDRCLFKSRPAFLKALSARNDEAMRLRVSLLFVLLAALIRGNFLGAIIGGLADGETCLVDGDYTMLSLCDQPWTLNEVTTVSKQTNSIACLCHGLQNWPST